MDYLEWELMPPACFQGSFPVWSFEQIGAMHDSLKHAPWLPLIEAFVEPCALTGLPPSGNLTSMVMFLMQAELIWASPDQFSDDIKFWLTPAGCQHVLCHSGDEDVCSKALLAVTEMAKGYAKEYRRDALLQASLDSASSN